MYTIPYTMNNSVCESCPLSDTLSLIELFPERMRWTINDMLSSNHGDKLFELMMYLSMKIFQGEAVSSDTLWAVQQRITTIYGLWNQWIRCSGHYLQSAYRKMNKWPFCLRKYMLEEAIKFFEKCWREINYNEEQFQAQIRDKWSIFYLSLVC